MFRGEAAKHVLLKWSETKRWREKLLYIKWLTVNENVACRKGLTCTNVMEIKNTPMYLITFRWQCENKVKKQSSYGRLQESRLRN